MGNSFSVFHYSLWQYAPNFTYAFCILSSFWNFLYCSSFFIDRDNTLDAMFKYTDAGLNKFDMADICIILNYQLHKFLILRF